NGRLHFTNVRVPRENLLNRYGSVAEDGTYSSPISSPGRRFFTPSLTTVRQDFEALGHDIMATVLDVLRDEPDAPDRTARVPEVIERASTAAPAA
ncbi:substrate-binding domain-containing protein, partial [Agromyces humi]|uniref:substrate-binding domain-containing protein n=1 Tax=Agromyces humi TaxID=1766800 RepID=UPI00135A3D6A